MSSTAGKRKILAIMLEGLISQSSTLSPLGGTLELDSVSKGVLLDRLTFVCESTAEEINDISKFLRSESYLRYIRSLAKIGEVIMQEVSSANKVFH